MNGFKMMADSYRDFVKQGVMTEDQVKRDVEIYEFLATCDTDDFCRLIDSSAFNDIIEGYLRNAIKNADLDEKSETKIKNELRYLFDEKTAKEVLGLK